MPSLDAEDSLRRGAAEEHENGGRQQLDLAGEKRGACLDLLRRRRAIARRAPIDRVGDVDVVLGKPDRRQHAVEQLSGAADEGLALQVLVAARSLSDQHDAGRRAASGKAQAFRGPPQRAALESGDQGLELRQRGDFGADAACRNWPCGSWGGARRTGGHFHFRRPTRSRFWLWGGKAVERHLADRLIDAHGPVPVEQCPRRFLLRCRPHAVRSCLNCLACPDVSLPGLSGQSSIPGSARDLPAQGILDSRFRGNDIKPLP